MIDIIENLKFYCEKIVQIKPGQHFLVIADNYARAILVGQIIMDLAASLGAEATLVVMEARRHSGHEPPKSIAKAMKEVDVIFQVVEKFDIVHTTARKEATEVGVKYFSTYMYISEDYFKKRISLDDLKIMGERTNKLSKMLTQASVARLTTPHGTDITMRIEGRQGVALHPLRDAAISIIPDYAEAAISPNEGSTEGIVVVDSSVQGWGYLLREPIHFTVRKGRIEDIFGDTEDSRKFRKVISTDEESNNCAAELGIGTSHTIPKILFGRGWDYAIMGTVHIAVGRNDDIGGQTWSRIHNDVLMTQPTVELDNVRIMENGIFKIDDLK